MRLPDGARSRALLIGTGAYEHLNGVPEIRSNLRALKSALESYTGLPPEHCRTLLDPPDLAAVGREVEAATRDAADLLLIYYSGHGLVASDGLLHLALPQTSQRLLPWSGIPFKLLHHAVQVSRAKTKVLILDCCFSGKATQLLSGEESTILGQITANGAFTLTSSPANEPSFAVDGRGHTVFTGALLKVLEHGSPRAGAMLTLGDIHLELLHHAQANHLPEPQKLGTHTAELLPLARNRQAESDEAGSLSDPAINAPGSVAPAKADPKLKYRSFADALVTARDIEAAQFKTVRLTAGYDEDEVDDFLDKAAAALDDPPLGPQRMRPEDVRNSHFTTTRMREGYDVEEVDSFLDRVELEFLRRQSLAAQYAAEFGTGA
ncbi:DivIVA domain-containing protein [Glycomyces luteolus]|uniref:Cell wall synthesis protein Wag31 n=1 Tax=Glycomyces luteolus TaxID=2670330 RepID=A0A9X3SQK2_9ACTN|nr:DivIVA domain-containing protein [Glycomyces luteolus]MDA1359039.1 DivIVA domain-containing protein [Glycomyces luteolus]